MQHTNRMKAKVTSALPDPIDADAMRVGDVAWYPWERADAQLLMRVYGGWVDLKNPESFWNYPAGLIGARVTPLPPGTDITLTVPKN